MHISNEKLIHAKSFTSIYDLFGPFNNILYKNIKKHNNYSSDIYKNCEDADNVNLQFKNYSVVMNTTPLMTSEKYHLLNKESLSHKTIVRSTSTIFYDLDEVAKRHSFHGINDISSSNVNLLKVMKIPLNANGFNGKTDAIVQECATQIQAKLLPRNSIEINSKKIKKVFPDEPFLSSEIFLQDNEFYDDSKIKEKYHHRDVKDRQQKFWSFAKYRTEYTNPISEEKKRRKKDRGKRTEDPCPCQLFSYACPCTDKKSLTELAKNSKSLTVADQITSTMMFQDERREPQSSKCKKPKNPTKEDKLLSTDYVEPIEKYQVIPAKTGEFINVPIKHDMPTLTDIIQLDNASIKSKSKQVKKRRKITCPKCRENVDVFLSTTDEEESMKYVNSSVYHFKECTSKTGYKSSKCNKHKSVIAEDNCGHQPQCELIPVCQILPTDNVYLTHKCIRQQPTQKSTPKIIRITKACRHHPPCTVVPSCQRANVLKNNCEYVPPCLHRPRCVNLPLCVPLKNLHYEETLKTVDNESTSCPHSPKCKYVPECQYEHSGNYNLDNHLHIVSQVQNACEVLSEFQQPQQMLSSKVPTSQNIAPSSQIVPPSSCFCCKSNKSCQFNCPDCKCGPGNAAKDINSNDAIIFIRDVGCQFRHKRCSHKDSEQSKVSSGSFDFVDVKMGNYYTNVHTLRYEDKYTNPMVEEDMSETSISITSLEIDSQCPTHGERASRKRSERATGFMPKQNTSPYVAYTTQRSQVMPSQTLSGNNEYEQRAMSQGHAYSAFPVKSHRSFMRGKYKKMFTVKRRKKSKASSHGFGSHSKKQMYVQNFG